jgi:hypothetical protein
MAEQGEVAVTAGLRLDFWDIWKYSCFDIIYLLGLTLN